LNTKRKAGIVLVAIILGLIISPAVPIEDSSLAHYQTNFKITDQFSQKENLIVPIVIPRFEINLIF